MSDQVRSEFFRTFCLDDTVEYEITGLTFHSCEPVDQALSPNILSLMELRKIWKENQTMDQLLRKLNSGIVVILKLPEMCLALVIGDNLACVYLSL